MTAIDFDKLHDFFFSFTVHLLYCYESYRRSIEPRLIDIQLNVSDIYENWIKRSLLLQNLKIWQAFLLLLNVRLEKNRFYSTVPSGNQRLFVV